MLISPTKKRLDDLEQRLREIRGSGPRVPFAEEEAIKAEIQQLREQLQAEVGGPAVLKG